MTLLKRILTEKSTIGFGRHRNLTVRQVIDIKRSVDLLTMYYKLDRIDFNQSVKDELYISKELEINKPGKLNNEDAKVRITKCLDAYYDNLRAMSAQLGYTKIETFRGLKKTNKYSNKVIKENSQKIINATYRSNAKLNNRQRNQKP